LPQNYSQTVKQGMKVDLTFAEHAGKVFQGTLTRTADAIDPVSRTLLVEIDVDNRGGELLPGSLAQVHFKTPAGGPVFVVPSAALIFRKEGMRVGIVAEGNVARLVPVVIGEDDGASVQIVNGLNATDRVIQDPPDALIDGEKLTVVTPGKPPEAGGK
jgi:multidrug efflux pump subunit AcrA (membrane-fusion protein)